jgi:NADPH2:quinone reductase
MKVVRVHEHGGPEVLEVEELPTPAPGSGEALVRVGTSGVNFFDIRQRTGDFKVDALPISLGMEGAGVVEALGPESDEVQIGDRVAWHWHQGSYASHAVVPVDELVPLPASIGTRVAASIMLQGLTAHALACSAYAVQPGETCLVHAAAGGLGGLLTQIAKIRGARVIGTVSQRAKVPEARKVGVDEVIVYTDEDLAEAARSLTGGRGVDVVYDGVGKETFFGGLEALKPRGYMILFGQASGAVPPIDTHLLQHHGGRYLTRAAFGQDITDRSGLLTRSNEIFEWIDAGKLNVRIAETYKLDDAAKAHEALSSRTVSGKLLLEDGSSE